MRSKAEAAQYHLKNFDFPDSNRRLASKSANHGRAPTRAIAEALLSGLGPKGAAVAKQASPSALRDTQTVQRLIDRVVGHDRNVPRFQEYTITEGDGSGQRDQRLVPKEIYVDATAVLTRGGQVKVVEILAKGQRGVTPIRLRAPSPAGDTAPLNPDDLGDEGSLQSRRRTVAIPGKSAKDQRLTIDLNLTGQKIHINAGGRSIEKRSSPSSSMAHSRLGTQPHIMGQPGGGVDGSLNLCTKTMTVEHELNRDVEEICTAGLRKKWTAGVD